MTVFVRQGTYYLGETLTLGPEESGRATAPILYSPFEEEIVTLSGGLRLNCDWRPYHDGIFVTEVPKSVSAAGLDQFFVNGKRQVLARYPNKSPRMPI